MNAKAMRAPGPRGKPFTGSLQALRRNRLAFVTELARDYGPVARFEIGPVIGHLVTEPAHVKHVLVDHAKGYTKQTRGFAALRPLLGEGLLTSDGAFWLRQRRIAQPAFHKERIAGFAKLMSDLAEEQLARWDELAAKGEPVDMLAEMMTLTLRIVARSLLSKEVGHEADRVGRALTVALGWANDQISTAIRLPRSIPTPGNRRIGAANRILDDVVDSIIAERRAGGADPGDLLSMLMAARDPETGEAMNDKQLRDEVMTLFLAGHETTANLLTWTWCLLARFPAVGRSLRAELASVVGDRAVQLEDVPKLPQTRRILDESLRLYPPAWSFGRAALDDDELGGFHIPKGSLVILNPFLTHRLPAYWSEPEGFDPDRFEPAKVEVLPRFAYFPFGGGPRQCIGNNFALMEATILLAAMARRFRPELLSGQVVEPEPTITLRPRGGLPMRLARV